MTNDKLVLNISKINISPDSTRLKYSQDERGKQVDLTVIDSDGTTAYDLTGKKIIFSEIKDGGKIIIDDETSHFIRTADNDKIGKFTYVFVDQTYQQSGEAHFEFTTDIEHVDTTINFDISIVNSAQLKPDNTSYVSSLIALEAHYRATISNADAQTQNLINSLTDKINQAISNGQNDIANELSDARTKLQAIQDQENKLVASWTTELNTQKQDFANLESQWQEQSKSISDSYQAKINEINTQAQSQHDSIQDAADQQLKNNQSANDAEIAKIESETKTKLDEVEKAKNDAIADLTAQRDAAISQAKVDFQAKIDAFQKDYDAWKSATLADFTKQLADINTNISNDQSTLKDFDKQLDYTKQELAAMVKQLDSLDFTKFVTGDTFKTAMAKKASGLKVMGLGGEYVMAVDQSDQNINGLPNGVQGLADIGVLSGALQVLADAILDKNHYTKPEVDKMVNDAKNAIMGVVDTKANVSDLNDKADKSQIQSLSSQLESYKQENDNLKNENSQLTNRVQTLENKQFIAHVASEDQVASQTAPIVIVDD
ncbi:DUF2479 domain-containing protein [Lactobacillus crispatus]|uniref:DUF2479 domain-containing protein n=1 Tax=Lactobacillus crispatus TaxID=47770 RepID=A0A6A1Z762_9LACO|nr:DUF2479 domain-containing protein [Lactobacillus crispatus]KAB1977213.1 DUF2479 domain-containing protein [Lactobacillus crispatus]MCT3538057.1 DUF2479 domain-containing protein [Lactobacillus crispatus]